MVDGSKKKCREWSAKFEVRCERPTFGEPFFSRVLELAAERSDEIREQDWTGEFGPNSEEENGRIEGNYE